jgi:acetyl-CoA carboxylase biotin carboxyl carrier protein
LELKQIKELMAAMGRTGVSRLSLKKEGFELELERDDNGLFKPDQMLELSEDSGMRTEDRAGAALARNAATDLGGARMSAKAPDVEGIYITSPMVGTFYSSPSPEDAPFLKVGDRVEKNTVVCIIEAMKVMNEVKAGVAGVVAEILVESGHPVEFGTKLFRITQGA